MRYLELAFKTADLAQLRLVREALLERGHWLREAPFLAHRLELALPTGTLWGQAYYRVGLGMYDALAGRQNIGSSRLVGRRQLEQTLPGLKACQGAVAYSDGQFDDARLNLLLALTAARGGAELRSHCRVVELEQGTDGRLCGAVSESRDGVRERWRARVIVNATGIGADGIRRMADASAAPRMLTSRGSHIVLKEQLCPAGLGLLVPSTDDGQFCSCCRSSGNPGGHHRRSLPPGDGHHPTDAEQGYLLDYVQRWFPGSSATVTSRWAGGRPLLKPAGAGLDSSRVVREHEVETLPCGLVSVMGGKWTTCRPMALDTLEAVEQQLGAPLSPPQQLPLIGAAETPDRTAQQLAQQRLELEALLADSPRRQEQIAHLQGSHGLNAQPLIESAPAADRVPLSEVIPICTAEIQHAIRHEHARAADDVLSRRCRLGMVDQAEAQRLQPLVEQALDASGINPGA